MLPMGTPLIVVDMQNGFLNPKSEHVIGPVRILAERWIAIGWPVYFTKFINAPGSQWQEWLGWSRLQTPPETDLTDALADLVAKGRVVEKRSYTSLTGAIEEDLRENDWEAAVLCGVATDGCVMETAVDLFQIRVRPLVVIDACASHAGHDIHEMGRLLLQRSIGTRQLVLLDEILQGSRSN